MLSVTKCLNCIHHKTVFITYCISATLMVNSRAAKTVPVSDQISMMTKSGVGKEEAMILSQKIPCVTSIDSSPDHVTVKKTKSIDKNNISVVPLNLEDGNHGNKNNVTDTEVVSGKATSDVREIEKQVPTEDGNSGEIITPRSEDSQTESQRVESSKETTKTNNEESKHLDAIGEEQDKVINKCFLLKCSYF